MKDMEGLEELHEWAVSSLPLWAAYRPPKTSAAEVEPVDALTHDAVKDTGESLRGAVLRLSVLLNEVSEKLAHRELALRREQAAHALLRKESGTVHKKALKEQADANQAALKEQVDIFNRSRDATMQAYEKRLEDKDTEIASLAEQLAKAQARLAEVTPKLTWLHGELEDVRQQLKTIREQREKRGTVRAEYVEPVLATTKKRAGKSSGRKRR